MPKFKVHVRQFVEELAELEIEAEDAESAVTKAQSLMDDFAVDTWEDGSDIRDEEVYCVRDAAGDVVWENVV